MKKFIAYLIVCLFGTSIGYFIENTASALSPSWRWIIINNSTACKIQSISVIMQDRTTSANNEQLKNTKYPNTKDTNEEYIPILVSENDTYNIEVEFFNCKKSISKLETIKGGMYINALISGNDIQITNR